jgi:hypothetical protein
MNDLRRHYLADKTAQLLLSLSGFWDTVLVPLVCDVALTLCPLVDQRGLAFKHGLEIKA